MFRKMPFILLVIILAMVLLQPIIPTILKQVLYSISLSIKGIIIFLLPVIIFCLLFKAAVTLTNQATKIIGLILICVCLSNFISTFLSHYVGMWVYSFDLSIISPKEVDNTVQTLWILSLPQLISNDKAMFLGIITGILTIKLCPKYACKFANFFDKFVTIMLNKFSYIIPLFVIGFIVKAQEDGIIHTIIKDYATIFTIVALAQFCYIFLVYFILDNFKLQNWIVSIRNMLPAGISGFSTMSSAATIPLTIVGAENNLKNKDIAHFVIPATVNIHLVGDCFAIPIFAYAILKSFGMAEPSLIGYIVFTFYFVLAKFSVAAIPGGGIIVMLPILSSHLGFNAEMMSLITTLYILFDPVITCANVLGNGAFAKMIDKMVQLLKFN